MKNIKHSIDWIEIKDVLGTNNTYASLVYDGSPELADYDLSGKLWFILREKNVIAGIIVLEPLNNIMWNCHVAIFEQFRKNGSEEWGKLVADYMSKHGSAKKLLAITPYLAAKKYAERIGFKQLTVLTNSIKKNGELMDQYLLELTL